MMIVRQSAGKQVVKGVVFAVDWTPDCLIGHSWVGDQETRQVFAVVGQGSDQDELRADLQVLMEDIEDYIRTVERKEPKLVSLGFNPSQPEMWEN